MLHHLHDFVLYSDLGLRCKVKDERRWEERKQREGYCLGKYSWRVATMSELKLGTMIEEKETSSCVHLVCK